MIIYLLYLCYKISHLQSMEPGDKEFSAYVQFPAGADILTKIRLQADELAKLRKRADSVMRNSYPFYFVVGILVGYALLSEGAISNVGEWIGVTITYTIGSYLMLLVPLHALVRSRRKKKQKNQRMLATYLTRNCLTMGYVQDNQWGNVLRDGLLLANVSGPYWTTFSHVVISFSHGVQSRYIDDEESTQWMQPVLSYLLEHSRADVQDLEAEAQKGGLRYTHYEPDGLIVYRHMEQHRTTDYTLDGNPCFKVQTLQKKDVADNRVADLYVGEEQKKGLLHAVGKSLVSTAVHLDTLLMDEYYLHVYQVSDEVREQAGNGMETEEISFDDL